MAKEKKEKKVSKVDRAYDMFKELKAEGLKPKEIYPKIAEELVISARSARGYVWRKENPEKYKALLERYFSKKKVRLEAEKGKAEAKEKADAEKQKKSKGEE